MREILFRGKRKDTGEWVYWNEYGEYTEPYCTWHDSRSNIHELDVITETVGQFTGLKDKKGNRIFEGDKTTHDRHDTEGVWEFSEHFNCFYMVEEDGGHRLYFEIDSDALMVFGNIYE